MAAGTLGWLIIGMGLSIYFIAILMFTAGMSSGRGSITLTRGRVWGKGSFLTQLLVVATFLMILGSTLVIIS